MTFPWEEHPPGSQKLSFCPSARLCPPTSACIWRLCVPARVWTTRQDFPPKDVCRNQWLTGQRPVVPRKECVFSYWRPWGQQEEFACGVGVFIESNNEFSNYSNRIVRIIILFYWIRIRLKADQFNSNSYSNKKPNSYSIRFVLETRIRIEFE